MTTPDHDPRADALRLSLQLLAILGPPAVAAVARTVRSEWPELIAALESALERDVPPIAATPPTAESARAILRARRDARRLARMKR